MDLSDYQAQAERTISWDTSNFPTVVGRAYDLLLHHEGSLQAAAFLEIYMKLIFCIGLAGEVGELLEHVKKAYGHGHTIDREAVFKESGDIKWYGAAIDTVFNFDSSLTALENIQKLKKRYPNKFTTEASIARVDTKDED